MAGISYFKAALPKEITFKNYQLHPEQKKFFEKIFLHGLGEFFYVNDLDPCEKINFIETKHFSSAAEKDFIVSPFPLREPLESVFSTKTDIAFTQQSLPTNAKTLLPIGGGKDSLVSAVLLDQAGIDYTPWIVGETAIQHDCCNQLKKKPLVVQRKICPNLIKLNQTGALNGHIPISAIWAFLSVCTALLTDHTHVAMSNEASASSENLEFKGLKINHQYSKSLEFEEDFQQYVNQFINGHCAPLPSHKKSKKKSAPTNVYYFSLLRQLREIDIAKIFAEHCWDDFKHIFASCNRNFTLTNKSKRLALAANTSAATKKWCAKCPKCAFVFLILAPFVDRPQLIEVFGTNLFVQPELNATFEELLGISGHKPLECVGEIKECREALHGATKNWPEVIPWTKKIAN
jgi:hypothetical protein